VYAANGPARLRELLLLYEPMPDYSEVVDPPTPGNAAP
jgi:hypothetical protein